MAVKTIDTEQIKNSIDLREYAGRYTTLRRESAKELAGPCPKCGGNDRFHCTAEWFFCRQCHQKPGDAIEFVSWMDGCDFKEAVARLTNAPLPAPATKRTPTRKPQAKQAPDWQRDAKNIVDHAHWRLLEDDDAAPGRAYLENERKLDPDIWLAYRLGYVPSAPLPGTWDDERKTRTYPGQPAITIPWYRNGELVAVRYRFLQKHTYTDAAGRERTESKSSLSGSDFAGSVFGGQALEGNTPELSAALLVEGEFNAMSAWQVAKDSHLDVFSIGSQDAKPTGAMLAHLKRYPTVLCWLDEKGKVSKLVAEALPDAFPISSPGGKDANDLLKDGMLGGFLANMREQAARSAYERERLLWDLCDAARGWYGCDSLTAKVITSIANMLGKSVQLTEIRPGTWRALDAVQHVEIAPAAARPELPAELWRQGIADFTQAWDVWQALRSQYAARLGKDTQGFYVR